MADDDRSSLPSDAPGLDRGVQPGVWIRRIVWVLVLLVVAYLTYLMAASYFPRWWAQRVGRQIDGRMSSGILWGLFYGGVFTAVPLLVLSLAGLKAFNWPGKLVIAVVAIALAAPNWLTLSVVFGTNRAAHAGERIMDVDAPGFRAASAFGAVGGAVVALAVIWFVFWSRHRRHQVHDLKAEIKARNAAEKTRLDKPANDDD